MRVDRSRLPALGPDPSFTFPELRKHRVSNTLRVWTVEHRDLPVVSVVLLIPVGSAADPEGAEGLAALTADLVDDGSGERSGLDMQQALARLGAHLDLDVTTDATVVAVTALAQFREEAASLLAEMVTRPRFEPGEFARARELRLTRLLQMRQVPGAVADRTFIEELYARHPYGHLTIGAEASLRRLTPAEVSAFHHDRLCGAPWTLIVVGDGSHDELLETAAARFPSVGSASAETTTWVSRVEDPVAAARRLLLVDRPGAVQSELRIGHVGVARDAPEYHALVVLNMLLGGQFVSRINLNLRENKGYTYGARSAFDFRLGRGPFIVSTSVETGATEDAVRELIREIDAMRGSRPPGEQEMDVARAALTRGFPRNFETAGQIARAAMQMALYDLPDTYFSEFVPRVTAVTSADVTRAAAAHLRPEEALVVVVGAAERVATDLERLGFGAPVVIRPS